MLTNLKKEPPEREPLAQRRKSLREMVEARPLTGVRADKLLKDKIKIGDDEIENGA